MIKSLTREIIAELAKVDTGLGFVFGCHEDVVDEFCLKTQGHKDHVPAVLAMVEWAPTINGFRIRAFAPRMASPDARIRSGTVEIGARDLTFLAYRLPDSKLGISIHVPGLSDDNRQAMETVALLLLDHVAGEYDALVTIDAIWVEPIPDVTSELRPFHTLGAFLDDYKESADFAR